MIQLPLDVCPYLYLNPNNTKIKNEYVITLNILKRRREKKRENSILYNVVKHFILF